MATADQIPGGDVMKAGPFKAASDLSGAANQYKFVKAGATIGEVAIAGAGERTLGALQNRPKAGAAAAIVAEGESLLVVDGSGTAIAYGDSLKSDASGRGVKTTTATDIIGAIALDSSSAAGDKIRVRVFAPRPYG